MTTAPRVLVDGVAFSAGDAVLPVFDGVVLRGDGCFEAIRSYRGVPFQSDAHLARLRRSAAMLELDLPDKAEIAGWVDDVSAAAGDGIVRILATRGGTADQPEGQPRVVVMALSLPPTEPTVTLAAVPAPWHAGGAAWELSGAKTLSYAPNMAATRAARRSGKSDALLVSNEGWVLEGPTFSVGWVRDGVLETPTLDLGILDSITRRVLLEEAEGRGVAVVEGTFDLDRLLGADEALAFSTVKEVTPVIEVDDRNYPIGEVSIKLAGAFAARVQAETRTVGEFVSRRRGG
ncbi:MAG TPA: aminotransferase class IV [Acidimicrobiia bacterium]|nr:aminotransferase class IV [Acidimicrobiia bacterium]